MIKYTPNNQELPFIAAVFTSLLCIAFARSSNFCQLCSDVRRGKETGMANHSDCGYGIAVAFLVLS